MLKIVDLQQQMLNEPAQPHQQPEYCFIDTGENPVCMLIVGEGGFVR